MFNVKSVDEVFQILKDNFSHLTPGREKVSLTDAVGRITAWDICAPEDIPGFNRSSVDGYAVISSDTFGAGESIPAQLQLVGEVKMGIKPAFAIKGGQTAYVPTGGELPENADAVVMVEYAEDYKDGYIYINKPAAPGNNVVFKGDDTRAGSIVIKRNHRLRPQDIGALAALGCSEVPVKRRVRIGIISTGDEVVDINSEISGAKVRDVNTYSLHAGIVEHGGEPRAYGIVKDDFEKIRGAVGQALDECDIVLISGGSSVGTRDETFRVINSFGPPGVLVHGVAVKPGKPTIIGKVNGKAVFGLPGHPASAYFIFRIFVCHLMDIINGFQEEFPKKVHAVMACNYPSNNGREEYVPVRLDGCGGKFIANPVFSKSGLITSLTAASGYIHISRGSEGLEAGEAVEVIIF